MGRYCQVHTDALSEAASKPTDRPHSGKAKEDKKRSVEFGSDHAGHLSTISQLHSKISAVAMLKYSKFDKKNTVLGIQTACHSLKWNTRASRICAS